MHPGAAGSQTALTHAAEAAALGAAAQILREWALARVASRGRPRRCGGQQTASYLLNPTRARARAPARAHPRANTCKEARKQGSKEATKQGGQKAKQSAPDAGQPTQSRTRQPASPLPAARQPGPPARRPGGPAAGQPRSPAARLAKGVPRRQTGRAPSGPGKGGRRNPSSTFCCIFVRLLTLEARSLALGTTLPPRLDKPCLPIRRPRGGAGSEPQTWGSHGGFQRGREPEAGRPALATATNAPRPRNFECTRAQRCANG